MSVVDGRLFQVIVSNQQADDPVDDL